jgi:hypothetical protein
MKKPALFLVCAVVLIMCFSTVEAATEAQIQTAIDAGMAWLAAKQDTMPGPNYGSWGTSQLVGKTGLAVKKFEHHATDPQYGYGLPSPFHPDYPYRDVVQRGID